METAYLLIGLLAYVLVGRLIMLRLAGNVREAVLAIINLLGVYFFLFYGSKEHYALRFAVYLALVICLYLTVYLFTEKRGWWPWLAFFSPLVALVMVRHVPDSVYGALGRILGRGWSARPNLIGISYLAFRCSRLVLEVRNGSAKKPNFLEYVNFAFFLPTMSVGPINTYTNYREGFEGRYKVPVGRAALRILVGAVKYQFLSSVFSQLNYESLLLDDSPHKRMDLLVAVVFYFLYLYCNFSGFCDMAIGAAALIGIRVPENFENPLAARNVKEYWNRWHITLSQYMRDVVFVPLSKRLIHLTGPAFTNHAIAIAIAVVFLLVGIWHGLGWNYVAFGAAHSVGLVTNHYYTIGLKKWLGREGFKAYNANPWIHAVAIVLTFCYCSACLFLFANTFPKMREILSVLN
jgi:D-alanyl-lipoteichoic acid acyltransferase DltB (MBOAT superfamily)